MTRAGLDHKALIVKLLDASGHMVDLPAERPLDVFIGYSGSDVPTNETQPHAGRRTTIAKPIPSSSSSGYGEGRLASAKLPVIADYFLFVDFGFSSLCRSGSCCDGPAVVPVVVRSSAGASSQPSAEVEKAVQPLGRQSWP